MYQVEVPEWYVPGAVRAKSPETPRVSAAVQASTAATQEALAAFHITHGQPSTCMYHAESFGTLLHTDVECQPGAFTKICQCYILAKDDCMEERTCLWVSFAANPYANGLARVLLGVQA